MEIWIGLGAIIYMVIALFITVTFDVEPAGSLLWILFPIIIPIVKSRERKEKMEREKAIREMGERKPMKPLPTFQSFLDKN